VFDGDDFTCSSKRVKGSYSQCVAVDVVPLGFQATSETSGGSKEANCDGEIGVPPDICVLHTREDSDLIRICIDCIFPRLNTNMSNKNYITSRAILSTCNEWIDMINMKNDTSFLRG
jgi:hypothetical protein